MRRESDDSSAQGESRSTRASAQVVLRKNFHLDTSGLSLPMLFDRDPRRFRNLRMRPMLGEFLADAQFRTALRQMLRADRARPQCGERQTRLGPEASHDRHAAADSHSNSRFEARIEGGQRTSIRVHRAFHDARVLDLNIRIALANGLSYSSASWRRHRMTDSAVSIEYVRAPQHPDETKPNDP